MKLVWLIPFLLVGIVPVFANEGFMPVYSPPSPPNGSGPITEYCITGSFLDSYNATTKLFTCGTPSGSGGENNTGSNVGSGVEIYKQKVGVALQFRTLVNDTNILIDQLTDTISFSLNTLSKSQISSIGTWGWNEVSKVGSSLNDLANVASSCAVGDLLIFNSTSFWDCYTATASSLKVNNQAAQNGRFVTGINNVTGVITTQNFQVNTQSSSNDVFITGINNQTGSISTKTFSVNTKDCSTQAIKSIDNSTGDVTCISVGATSREDTVAEWETDKTWANIGLVYVDVYLTANSNGEGQRIDTTGKTTVTFNVMWTKVGAGTQKCQIIDVANNANILIENTNLASGQNTNATQNIPAGLASTIKTYKPRCLSSTAADDPVWLSGQVLLK